MQSLNSCGGAAKTGCRGRASAPEFLLLTLALLLTLPAAARDLRGEVSQRTAAGEPEAVANAAVKLKETGDSALSKTSGEFRIQLPDKDRFQPGQRVSLKVDKDGHCVLHPHDGGVVLPADEYEVVPVRLLPAGATEKSESCIEKLIADIAQKSTEQIKLKGRPEDMDFSRYIKDWANQYGFSAEQARAEIDQWVAEIQANQDDFYKLGMAEFAEKNFGKAAQLFTESAESKRAQRLKAEAEAERLREEEARDFRQAGDAWFNAYEFYKALDAYKNALEVVEREARPELWADLMILSGVTYIQLGISAGDIPQEHLENAVKTLEMAAEVYTPEQFPIEWVMVQNNVGVALIYWGERVDGKTSQILLNQAVDIFRAILEICGLDQCPVIWGMAQTHLGTALYHEAVHVEETESGQALAEALNALTASFDVLTRTEYPYLWAQTQQNISNVLAAQAKHISESEIALAMLDEAESGSNLALEVFSLEEAPYEWASTQSNLAGILRIKAAHIEGEAGLPLVKSAIEHFHLALKFFTRENFPQQWAAIMNNLGNALSDQSQITDSDDSAALLNQAIESYQVSLQIYSRDALPQGWAMAQRNLGQALGQLVFLSEEDSKELITQSIYHVNESLTIFTFEEFPQDWVTAKNLLAVLYALDENWDEAMSAFISLLEAVPENEDARQFVTQLANLYWNDQSWELAANGFKALFDANPEDEEAYTKAADLYHNKLFEFNAAFGLHEKWLSQHPNDEYATLFFTENHLTTGRFAEARERLEALLSSRRDAEAQSQNLGGSAALREIPDGTRIALMLLDIAAAVGQGDKAAVAAKQAALRKHLSSLENLKEIEGSWSFGGTRHFIAQHPAFQDYPWLDEAMEKVEQKDWAGLAAGLEP